MSFNICPASNDCRNGGEGCYSKEPKTCVRFLPLTGTNLTELTGTVETPPEIDCDKFSQYFTNWIESMGWSLCCSFSPYKEEYEDI